MGEHKYREAYLKGIEAGKKLAFSGYCEQCYDELSKREQVELMIEWGADKPKLETTNGDVIKAVFPNVIGYGEGEACTYYGTMRFDTIWWNAPYKREVAE